MSITDTIRQRLQVELQPTRITIQDDSEEHAGHASAMGAAHLTLYIVSAKFEGLSELSRHRLIYKILAKEMKTAVHALSIRALTPTEADKS